MELRVDAAQKGRNAFSFALQLATEYASTCDHPFDATELWRAATERGLHFEEKGTRVPDGPTTEHFGVFTSQLALDHLFNQRLIQRSINAKGDWVYRGST